MTGFRIGVEGAKEFRSELRSISPQLTKIIQQENKGVANDVAERARNAYASLYPRRSGDGISSIRGLATPTRAQVAIGGTRAPYILGQEFGSNRFKQFGSPSRGGRFFWPTLIAGGDDLLERYDKAVAQMLARAFPTRSIG